MAQTSGMIAADTQRMMDEWVPIAGGTGAINVQVSFKPAQVSRSSQILADARLP